MGKRAKLAVVSAEEVFGTKGPELRAHAVEQALRGAKYPAHSTSVSANRSQLAETAAWAKYAERGWL